MALTKKQAHEILSKPIHGLVVNYNGGLYENVYFRSINGENKNIRRLKNFSMWEAIETEQNSLIGLA